MTQHACSHCGSTNTLRHCASKESKCTWVHCVACGQNTDTRAEAE